MTTEEREIFMEEKYGKEYTITKVAGTKVYMGNLADNQSVCYGDGKTFYYLLT